MTLPIYVINLPRDADRMQRMASQLDGLGLAFEQVPAVDGRDLSPSQRHALYDAEANRRSFHQPLVDGEIGCYASHLEVWQRVVEAGAPTALVLEDDVTLTPALGPVLRAIAALALDWDMVKLIGRNVGNEKPWRNWPLGGGVDLIRYRRVPSLTGAYVVSLPGARKLLAHRRPFFRPVDTDLRHWWECDLRLYGAYPYPVRHAQVAIRSSIGDRELARGAAHRWRKISDQLHYSLSAWWANLHSRKQAPPRA